MYLCQRLGVGQGGHSGPEVVQKTIKDFVRLEDCEAAEGGDKAEKKLAEALKTIDELREQLKAGGRKGSGLGRGTGASKDLMTSAALRMSGVDEKTAALLAVLGVAMQLQGCDLSVPQHTVGNWRAKEDYLIKHQSRKTAVR